MLVLAFHFAVIILYNIVSSVAGYEAVYGPNKRSDARMYVQAFARQAIQLAPLRSYGRFSGTNTGYGFFAPQVGSQYISLFTLYAADGSLLGEYSNPGLRQEESLHRYSGFLDLFQDILPSRLKTDSLAQRYARAVLYSLGRHLGRQKGASRVRCQVLVYRYRRLWDRKNKKTAQLLPLYETSLQLH